MSEVYLVAGGEIPPAENELIEWLEKQRINLAWLDEIQWISTRSSPEVKYAIPQVYWPVNGSTVHRLLHLIFSEFLLSKREMSVVVQEVNDRHFALILGSPAALGRRNLLPKARLSGFALPPDNKPSQLVTALKSLLALNDIEAKTVHTLFTSHDLKGSYSRAINRAFKAVRQETEENCIHGLIKMTNRHLLTGDTGLFLELSSRLVTLVEKI